jgi:hypothetical protein
MASIAPLALCAGSPAIGATYTVEASASGGSPINYQGDTPLASSGQAAGGRTVGGAYSVTASNIDGGYASAAGSVSIGDFAAYNNEDNSNGISGGGYADVSYSIRVTGPATNSLIPVHVTLTASVGAPDVPTGTPDDPHDNGIVVQSSAQVFLDYLEGLLNPPALPFVGVASRYDYRHYTDPGNYPAPSARGRDREVQ